MEAKLTCPGVSWLDCQVSTSWKHERSSEQNGAIGKHSVQKAATEDREEEKKSYRR